METIQEYFIFILQQSHNPTIKKAITAAQNLQSSITHQNLLVAENNCYEPGHSQVVHFSLYGNY